MADLYDYRPADEIAMMQAADARIETVLDETLASITSLQTAMELDEPGDVIELWTDRIWNGLRERLDPEQRLRAIILLLGSDAGSLSDRLAAEYRS